VPGPSPAGSRWPCRCARGSGGIRAGIGSASPMWRSRRNYRQLVEGTGRRR
jgi:hypothetical protein